MRRFSLPSSAVLLLAVVLDPPARAEEPAYDLLLRGGRVVDGSGGPWYRADVAVKGDTIAAVGRGLPGTARRTIEVAGRAVVPGFIDIHTHARRGIFETPTAENYVRQGVTTLIEGPDGGSPVPLRPFLDRVAALGTSVNFGSLVGQGSVREKVIGRADRRATPEEIAAMKQLVRQGMLDGAFGLSTGLFYVPGAFTPTEEVVELARVAGELGGIHVSHLRNEAKGVLDSVAETIAIGERASLPTQVTHHKIIGKGNWGRSAETLRLVREARARGVDATIDQYPYTASSTALSALLPAWALEGGEEATRRRLRDPAVRPRIHAAVVESLRYDRGGGDPANVQIAACGHEPALAGRNLAEITRERGRPVGFDTAADTVLEILERGGASAIYHAIGEEDLERILRDPSTMIASDGEIPVFGKASPHPRSYGTFARVLAVYVREKGVITLEEAVRKMSSMPAARLGLSDRGLLRPGMKADLAVFDPARVLDRATFQQPHQYAEGVSHVIVNGEPVLEDGAMSAARPGRVLFGPARR